MLTLISFSHVALTQLFLTQRPSLDQILVKGDLIITAATSNGMRSAMGPVDYHTYADI